MAGDKPLLAKVRLRLKIPTSPLHVALISLVSSLRFDGNSNNLSRLTNLCALMGFLVFKRNVELNLEG
ncbi:hypothetical protein IMY98_16340 [Klebsiella pneumoniae]|uniref:hypothetical protein n=1 Tax=Klebsiella pneumoniae TaxID=573 RepID=UPI001887FF3B|nr:hypothetical protein [Klebsiella pneumoniae]MBF2744596.1 hypothetical protein [Klebsiella pneumoniae]